MKRIQYNSPVILTFFLISLAALLLGMLTNGRTTWLLFSVYRAPLSPTAFLRLFTHVLGHADFSHFAGNMLLFLVIHPIFKLLIRKGHEIAVSWIYVFTLIIVLTFSISTAIGANNYIISNFPDQLDEFGVFCNSQDPALMELIAKSENNDGSCIRGTIAQGGDVPYEMVAQCVKDVMLGGAEFGYILPDRTYAVNSFGYHYDSRDAA